MGCQLVGVVSVFCRAGLHGCRLRSACCREYLPVLVCWACWRSSEMGLSTHPHSACEASTGRHSQNSAPECIYYMQSLLDEHFLRNFAGAHAVARLEKTFLSPQSLICFTLKWDPPSALDCMVRAVKRLLGDLSIFSTQIFDMTGMMSGLILRAGFISARGSMPSEKLRGAT